MELYIYIRYRLTIYSLSIQYTGAAAWVLRTSSAGSVGVKLDNGKK